MMTEEIPSRAGSPQHAIYKSSPTNSSSSHTSSSSFFSFRQFDIYTKIEEDYCVQTSGGAILTLAGYFAVAMLVFAELTAFFEGTVTRHMKVDTSLNQQLSINLDVTFHALPCHQIHLDAMDVAGDNQLDIAHAVYKQRLHGITLQSLGAPENHVIGLDRPNIPPEEPAPSDCQSCYGAESEEIKCCNTCDELKAAYEKKGWALTDILYNSTQCSRERAAQKGEACRIFGQMTVNKVAGNFHIAHGTSIVRDGRHIHQFVPTEAPGFNISHTVNSVTFGESYPGMAPSSLDNVSHVISSDGTTGLQQYFFKVMPARYVNTVTGAQINTYEYSVTKRFRKFVLPEEGQPLTSNIVLPGIFFVYELSPFLVEVTESTIPLTHLLTKLIAIAGGVFTMLGVLDTALYKLTGGKTRR